MFDMYYNLQLLENDDEWRNLGANGEPFRYHSRQKAQLVGEAALKAGVAQEAMVVKVTKALYSDVVTRQTMVMTTWELAKRCGQNTES